MNTKEFTINNVPPIIKKIIRQFFSERLYFSDRSSLCGIIQISKSTTSKMIDNGHKKLFNSYLYNDPNKENSVALTITNELMPKIASHLPFKLFLSLLLLSCIKHPRNYDIHSKSWTLLEVHIIFLNLFILFYFFYFLYINYNFQELN